MGTGVGATSGALAGAAIGAVGGPVGMAAGALVGAVTGGIVGKEVAESIAGSGRAGYPGRLGSRREVSSTIASRPRVPKAGPAALRASISTSPISERGMQLVQIWPLLKDSVKAWVDDYAPSMGAALAYYTVFSLAPLLLIVIAVAGLVFGHDAVRGEIVHQLGGVMGRDGATAVQGLLKSASEPRQGFVSSVVGFALLIVGATTVFAELQSALDRIWRVPAAKKTSGLWNLLRTRFLSFGLVLGLGFLMLISLVISAALSVFGNWYGGVFRDWKVVLHIVNIVVSLVMSAALFAMIYKFMPRARIAWSDVWIGAAVTAVLFEMGKFLLGLYLGNAGVASGFGAAGSLVLLIVWVYYSAQVFLLGAEFTWVYARAHGSHAANVAKIDAVVAQTPMQKKVDGIPSRVDEVRHPSSPVGQYQLKATTGRLAPAGPAANGNAAPLSDVRDRRGPRAW